MMEASTGVWQKFGDNNISVLLETLSLEIACCNAHAVAAARTYAAYIGACLPSAHFSRSKFPPFIDNDHHEFGDMYR